MSATPYYLERIQRGVDFIEPNLDEDLALSAIARAGGLSQWHYQRIFKSLTGETLKAYIRSRRMSRALDRLLTTDLRILDIALLAGFESQESFARAFKRTFDMTPMNYRKLGRRNLFVRKLELDEATLAHLQRNLTLEPELYDQPAMTLVGMRTPFHGADSELNNLGEKLPPLWAAFLERRREIRHARHAICYGVVQAARADSDLLDYHAAVEVSEIGPLPEGMAAVEIPASRYARFEHRGEAQKVDRTVSYAYATWLVQSRHRHGGGPDLESYDERYHPTDLSSVVGYAIPVTAAEA